MNRFSQLIIKGKIKKIICFSFILFEVDLGGGKFLNDLAGTTKVIAVEGRFENIELYLTAEPASLQEIKISTNAFDQNPSFFSLEKTVRKINVSLRNCISGEEMREDGR